MSEAHTQIRIVADECEVEHMKYVAKTFADTLEARQGYMTLQDWIVANYNQPNVLPLIAKENEKKVLRGLLINLLYLYRIKISHGDIRSENVLINGNNEVKLVGLSFATRTAETLEKDYEQLKRVLSLFIMMPRDNNFSHLIRYFSDSATYERHAMYIFNAPCVWDTQETIMAVKYLANKARRASSGLGRMRIRVLSDMALGSNKNWLDGTIQSSCFKGSDLPKVIKNRPYPCLLKYMRDKYCNPPTHVHGAQLTLDEVKEKFEILFPEYIAKLVELLASHCMILAGDPIDRSYVGSIKFS